MDKRFLSCVLVLVSLTVASAWVNGGDPSSTSFAISNRDASVGYTGDLNWSETLLTVPGRGGLDVDLVLKYNSFINLDQESSWVGLGFDMSVGYISRTVVNMPDEIVPFESGGPARGVFYDGTEVHRWDDPAVEGDERGWNYIKPQDRFFIVFSGSGTEIVASGYTDDPEEPEGNPESEIEFHTVRWRPWKIVPEFATTSGQRFISRFTVTKEDGTIYIFENPCWSKVSIGAREEAFHVSTSNMTTWPNYYSGWHNTVITPTDEDGFYEEPHATADNPGWNAGSFTPPAAPYIWFVTKILSPDYVDVNSNGPDDADKGNWVKLTYNYYTNPGGESTPNTASGYVYLTRFESCRRAPDVAGELPEGWYAEFFKSNRTEIHMACLSQIETPTHRAFFDTSYRSDADAVAWSVGANYQKHPKKLDRIILKSKLPQTDTEVNRLDFLYNDSLYHDRLPMTASREESAGGRLTLTEVKRYCGGTTYQVPPYRFEYTVMEHDYEHYYELNPNDPEIRDPWGYYSDGLLETVRYPTGGHTSFSYERKDYAYIQNTDKRTQDPGRGPGFRVDRIGEYTGLEGTNTPMETRHTDYEYGCGAILTDISLGTSHYKTPAAFTARDNYVGYDYVNADTTQAFPDDRLTTRTAYSTSHEGTSYSTAFDCPDESENPNAPPYLRFTSNEWKRGIAYGVSKPGVATWYSYTPFDFYKFTGHYTGDNEERPYYIKSGWLRLNNACTGTESTYYTNTYSYGTPPTTEAEADDYNGLPIQVETSLDLAETYNLNQSREGLSRISNSLGPEVVSLIRGQLGDAFRGGETNAQPGICVPNTFVNLTRKLAYDVRDTLDGLMRVRTAFITYAYKSSTDPPYSLMGFDGKHMMSQQRRVAVTDRSFAKQSQTETLFSNFDGSGTPRIYPSSSWDWLDKDSDNEIDSPGECITTSYLAYDNYGNLLESRDPYNQITHYEYAGAYSHSLLTKTINPLGYTHEVVYDPVTSLITKEIDANGREIDYEYDNWYQLSAVWLPGHGKTSYPDTPSLKYTYNWTWDIAHYAENPIQNLNWIRRGRLMENSLYDWTTSFYNGFGACFRIIRHYNTPTTDTGGHPLPGYFSGMYYDVETNNLGFVSRRFSPYEVIDGGSPYGNWNNALKIPFYSNDDFDPDNVNIVYKPFKEIVWDPGAPWGPCPVEVYSPADELTIFNAEYTNRTVSRARFFPYDYGNPYLPDEYPDHRIWLCESYDEEGRATATYYDGFGRRVATFEGAQYDPDHVLEHGGTWGTPSIEYQTKMYHLYDDLDRLITNKVKIELGSGLPKDTDPFYENHFTYDTFSRLTSSYDPDRGLLEYGHDDVGNLTAFCDPELAAQDKFVGYTYDDLYRVKTETVYDLSVPTMGGGSEDGEDVTTVSVGVDCYGRRVDLWNDSESKKIRSGPERPSLMSRMGKKGFNLYDDPENELIATYYYDSYPTGQPASEGGSFDSNYPTDYPLGKLTWVEDQIGKKYFYYDVLNRPVAMVSDRCYFDNLTLAHEYFYNIGGRLLSEKYPSGTIVPYVYDKIGRLINISGVYGPTEGGQEPPPGGDSLNEDYPGIMSKPPATGIGFRLKPSYLARKAHLGKDDGASTDLRMSGVSPITLDSTQGFEFDLYGRLKYLRPNNGCKTTITYDTQERQTISELRYDIGEEDGIFFDYSYDRSRNITQVIDNLYQLEKNRKKLYWYDSLDRLVKYWIGWDEPVDGKGLDPGGWDTPGMDPEEYFGPPPMERYGFGHVEYVYDALGNRLKEKRSGIEYNYGYDTNTVNNRLLSDPYGNSYTYNANGAVATKTTSTGAIYDYTYDYAGHLIKIHLTPPGADGEEKEKPSETGVNPDNNTNDTTSGEKDSSGYYGFGPPPPPPYSGEPDNNDNDAAASPPETTLLSDESPYVSFPEEWEFTYDGMGLKVYKFNSNSASKYIRDASGRVVEELSNDIRKSSVNVVKNPSFEIYSYGQWEIPENPPGEGLAGVGCFVARTAEEEADEARDAATDSLTVGDFAYWTEDVGLATDGEVVAAIDDVVEGRRVLKIARAAAGTEDFLVAQAIPLKNAPPREFELRFFAKTEGLTGDAYCRITTDPTGGEPTSDGGLPVPHVLSGTAAEVLDSEPITDTEWQEYRMVFASDEEYASLQFILDKNAAGALYIDRVSVAEYQNELANASFEDEGITIPGPAFEEWGEEGSPGVIDVGDGLLTANSAMITRSGSSVRDAVYQTKPVVIGTTYEFTVAMNADGLTTARALAAIEMSGFPTYYLIDQTGAPPEGGWRRYTCYYVAPADGDVTIRLGLDGNGTDDIIYFEDAGLKEIPNISANASFEGYITGDPEADFNKWEEEANGGSITADISGVWMGNVAAKISRTSGGGDVGNAGKIGSIIMGGGLDADPLSNTILKQTFTCLPHTEYEVTIVEKHAISANADYYGAFAVIGNIKGVYVDPSSGKSSYTGVAEVFNAETGTSGWTAHSIRVKSAADYFTITLGVGAGATGDATFDAILIRDLTSRRYEYIYGMGGRLAKLEYEAGVGTGQVYYDHRDILGSTVAMTDVDGDLVWRGDYAPFGESLEEQPINWGNPYTFLGNEDDGGLMDFNARFYDARVGRFTSPDPILNLSSSQTINPYVYCRNNPLKYTDPLGLTFKEPEQGAEGEQGSGGGGSGGRGRDPNAWPDQGSNHGQRAQQRPNGGGGRGGGGGGGAPKGSAGGRAPGKNGYLGSEGKSGSSIDPRANDAANVPDYVRAREDNAPPKEFGTLPSGDPLRKAGDLRKESAPHYGQGSLLEGLAKVGNGAWKMAVGIQMGFCTGALALYTWHTYGIIHLGSEVVKEFVIEKEFGIPVPGLKLFGEWTGELIWEGGKEEFEGCQEISAWIIENNNSQPYIAPRGGASPAHNIEPLSFYQYQLNFKIRIRIKVGE